MFLPAILASNNLCLAAVPMLQMCIPCYNNLHFSLATRNTHLIQNISQSFCMGLSAQVLNKLSSSESIFVNHTNCPLWGLYSLLQTLSNIAYMSGAGCSLHTINLDLPALHNWSAAQLAFKLNELTLIKSIMNTPLLHISTFHSSFRSLEKHHSLALVSGWPWTENVTSFCWGKIWRGIHHQSSCVWMIVLFTTF